MSSMLDIFKRYLYQGYLLVLFATNAECDVSVLFKVKIHSYTYTLRMIRVDSFECSEGSLKG